MIAQLTGAAARAFLVSLLLVMPALLLPEVGSDSTQIVVLVSLLAAVMVFAEYNSAYPSFVEFRHAPPFNRLRFVVVFISVLGITMMCRGKTEPSEMTALFTSLGTIIGRGLDFPYSPVRLMLLILPQDAPQALGNSLRASAGLSYFLSLVMMMIFVTMVRFFGWPARNGAFNVWINLPLFDPTAGGDVVARLTRDARINVALGFLLPFLIPAVVKAASGVIDPMSLENPQTMIWTVTLWAFLPATMIMRGIAMGRIAEMIEQKRRRAYAAAEADAEAFQTA